MGLSACPWADLPITTGPMTSGVLGMNELSISLMNTPGETNLKLFTDIFTVPFYKMYLFNPYLVL